MYTKENKACSRCKTVKSLSEFYSRSGRIGQTSSWCLACYASVRKSPETKAKEREWRRSNREKISNRRKLQYWKDPNTARAKTRAYYTKNPQVLRQQALRKRGLTIEQFNVKLLTQRQRCMLCGGEFATNGKAPVVDHDHRTGEVRGIIHSTCNSGLGFFEDNVNKLLLAVEYLRMFE